MGTSTANCLEPPSSDQDVKSVSMTQHGSAATGLARFAQLPELKAGKQTLTLKITMAFPQV